MVWVYTLWQQHKKMITWACESRNCKILTKARYLREWLGLASKAKPIQRFNDARWSPKYDTLGMAPICVIPSERLLNENVSGVVEASLQGPDGRDLWIFVSWAENICYARCPSTGSMSAACTSWNHAEISSSCDSNIAEDNGGNDGPGRNFRLKNPQHHLAPSTSVYGGPLVRIEWLPKWPSRTLKLQHHLPECVNGSCG